MANALRVWFKEIEGGHHAFCHFCTAVAMEVVTLEELDVDRHVTRKASFQVCDLHAHLVDQERRILLNKCGGTVAMRHLHNDPKPVIDL